MIKNWVVTTKQIKKKDKGFINHINYLVDKNRPSHSHTEMTVINNCSGEILSEIDARTAYRREAGLRGGGVRNYATSFVLNIPRSLDPQPSVDDWKKIAVHAIKAIAETNNINFDKMKSLCHCVIHDESQSPDKNSHLNLTVSNVVDNQVVKGISQLKTDYAVKQSFNRSMKKVLGHDHMKYVPGEPGKNVPLHVARAEKLEQLTQDVDAAERAYKGVLERFKVWSHLISQKIFKPAEKQAQGLAEKLDYFDDKEPLAVASVDSAVEFIEDEHQPPETAKVSSKRKRRKRKRKP